MTAEVEDWERSQNFEFDPRAKLYVGIGRFNCGIDPSDFPSFISNISCLSLMFGLLLIWCVLSLWLYGLNFFTWCVFVVFPYADII